MSLHYFTKEKVKRVLWSLEEDEKLIKNINTNGQSYWCSVPNLVAC